MITCLLYILLGFVSVTFSWKFIEVKRHLQLPPEVNEVIMQASHVCADYTGANNDIIKNFLQFRVQPDVETKDFIYCMFVGLNGSSVDGHLNQKFLSLFDPHPLKNDVKHVFDTCKSEDKERYIDTLYEEISCFFTKTPIKLGEDVAEDLID